MGGAGKCRVRGQDSDRGGGDAATTDLDERHFRDGGWEGVRSGWSRGEREKEVGTASVDRLFLKELCAVVGGAPPRRVSRPAPQS